MANQAVQNTVLFAYAFVLLGSLKQIYSDNTAVDYLQKRSGILKHSNGNKQDDIPESSYWSKVQLGFRLHTARKRSRRRRDVKGELISPKNASIRPYDSIVYISVGCTGTLISDQHVLTAAHCIFNGKSVRKGKRMSPLRVGFLQGSGKFHRIRVKKVFLSSNIKPNVNSRLLYDYAVLKLVRPHNRSWVRFKRHKGKPRFLTYSSYRRRKKRKTLVEFSYCSVLREGKYLYLVRESDCPSEPGTSGAPIFSTIGRFKIPETLGLVSAAAVFKSSIYGSVNVTVIRKFTDVDIKRIQKWMKL